MKKILASLEEMANFCGKRNTQGLSTAQLEPFLLSDPRLAMAIEAASLRHKDLRLRWSSVLKMTEAEQVATLQSDYLNFYAANAINPYVAMSAEGPWLITSCGAVLYDAGGYGMLGLGQNPPVLQESLSQKQVMANIMTANFSQKRFAQALRAEIGHRRPAALRHPFSHFACLNSGSEAVGLALRYSDIQAKKLTGPGGAYQGCPTKFLVLNGSFHGRTGRPAQVSVSSLKTYQEHLASFQGRDNLIVVEPNERAGLAQAFSEAKRSGFFIEAMLMEPVMGEGDPGKAISAEFYRCARDLSTQHNTLLIVDSIQAGFRAHGCLSITDYPGFEALLPPDMETYSKALNAGQYPLSVLALSPEVAQLHAAGVYGNTMTSNPRALDVASCVLEQFSPDLRANIVQQGRFCLEKFQQLQREFSDTIEAVQGTGLLFSLAINPQKAKVLGPTGLETRLRHNGLGVIHGGENSLRFTPHFGISSQEVELIISLVRAALLS